MPKISSWCLYILALALPVQTLIAQYSTTILHFPIWLNFWKELFCAIVIVDLAIYWFKHRTEIQEIKKYIPLLLITLITLIGSFNSLAINKVPLFIFIIGFRFDLYWLWFFAFIATFLLNFPQKLSSIFIRNLTQSIYVGFGICAFITGLSITFGQATILRFFGFGNESSTQYFIQAPTCHVVDFGNDACRLSGTFSTPNHFAGYLLLVLTIFLLNCSSKDTLKRIFSIIYSLLAILFIFLTFARFALLALIMSIIIITLHIIKKRYPKYSQMLSSSIIATIIIAFSVGLVFININPELSKKYLPGFIAKPSSTIEHFRRTSASLDILSRNWSGIVTGYGIGYVGPAGKVDYLDPTKNLFRNRWEYIAYRWGLVGEDLAIPENWYLQLILSGGIIYTLLYVILLCYPLLKQKNITYSLGFLSILLGNLFLHIWENQTIAIYWTLIFIYVQSHSKFDKLINDQNELL